MKPSLRIGLIVAGIAIVLIAAGILVIPRLLPYRFHGALLEPPKPAADFTLVGPAGRPIKLSDYRGKLVVLYFGYTYCPDVCPTTLADLARAMQKLGKRSDKVQVLMVTVDPERDTPERMAGYMTFFDPTFAGLSGTPDQIAAAAAAYGIYYQKGEGTVASGYTVDHTAMITVLDDEGRVRLYWPADAVPDDMAADLAHLLG